MVYSQSSIEYDYGPQAIILNLDTTATPASSTAREPLYSKISGKPVRLIASEWTNGYSARESPRPSTRFARELPTLLGRRPTA